MPEENIKEAVKGGACVYRIDIGVTNELQVYTTLKRNVLVYGLLPDELRKVVNLLVHKVAERLDQICVENLGSTVEVTGSINLQDEVLSSATGDLDNFFDPTKTVTISDE